MSLRLNSINGILSAPQRGSPPVETPIGYKRDPRNPFMFFPIINDCEYRKITTKQTQCCGKKKSWHCLAQDGKRVTAGVCKRCQDVGLEEVKAA